MPRRWIIATTLLGLGIVAAATALWATTPRSRFDVTADPLEGARPTPPASAPHVVVVIGCTVRKDQLQLYRPELDTTPWMVEQAAGGAVFEDMITAAPWTRPASVAILTGRHAAAVGMTETKGVPNKRSLADEVETLAEWFRGRGWRTVGGTANPNTHSVWNMHQGFDHYVQPPDLWSEAHQRKLHGVDLVDRVMPMVDGAEPTFLQLLMVDAHAPYPQIPTVPDQSVPAEVHRYRAGVRELDRALAKLGEALERRGMTRENTLFVFVNDHGEGLNMPAHHGQGHGRYLAPSAVGGVWWMTGPGVPEGVRVSGMASQVDVFATVTELAGVPRVLEPGQSMVGALSGGRTGREIAFTDTWFLKVNRAAAYSERFACQEDFGEIGPRDGKFKPGCFDRGKDPEHRRPGPHPALALELERWRGQLEADMVRFASTSDAEPSEATKKQLEALGYTQ